MTTPNIIPPRPQPPPVQAHNIPEELKSLPQWVVWRYTRKPDKKKPGGGKWDKPPINARTNRNASSSDPS